MTTYRVSYHGTNDFKYAKADEENSLIILLGGPMHVRATVSKVDRWSTSRREWVDTTIMANFDNLNGACFLTNQDVITATGSIISVNSNVQPVTRRNIATLNPGTRLIMIDDTGGIYDNLNRRIRNGNIVIFSNCQNGEVVFEGCQSSWRLSRFAIADDQNASATLPLTETEEEISDGTETSANYEYEFHYGDRLVVGQDNHDLNHDHIYAGSIVTFNCYDGDFVQIMESPSHSYHAYRFQRA